MLGSAKRKASSYTGTFVAVLVIMLAVSISYVAARAYQDWQTEASRLPTPSLKELADRHDVEIGNFAIPTRIIEDNYREILVSQFHFVLADNQPNWYFTDGGLRPAKDKYDYRQMDKVMDFAIANCMPVQAHHFVWGEEKWLPHWLRNGNYSNTELEEIIQTHIQTVGSHYKGKIREWTVVNEAFTRKQHVNGLRDWWADNTGGIEYIDRAFVAARTADPDAKLILNDFGNESINSVSNEMYEYVKDAKKRGVPIDGIGMQMHIDGRHPPTKDEVVRNMQRFADLGVAVYVTEFDVNMNDVKASSNSKAKIQGDIYYEMMRACIESRVCHSFAILGITDKETWYNYLGLKESMPLPFDENYNPKPAFFSMRDALLE